MVACGQNWKSTSPLSTTNLCANAAAYILGCVCPMRCVQDMCSKTVFVKKLSKHFFLQISSCQNFHHNNNDKNNGNDNNNNNNNTTTTTTTTTTTKAKTKSTTRTNSNISNIHHFHMLKVLFKKCRVQLIFNNSQAEPRAAAPMWSPPWTACGVACATSGCWDGRSRGKEEIWCENFKEANTSKSWSKCAVMHIWMLAELFVQGML